MERLINLRFIRRPRLIGALMFGVVVFLVLLTIYSATFAFLMAFDIAALVYFVLTIRLMNLATVDSMRTRAIHQDNGKWVVLTMSLLVALAVVIALSSELYGAKVKSIQTMGLACTTLLISWTFVVTIFAQQYAHDFYLKSGQLVFPGTDQPDYWDFTYFSAVLSMCFQTSDVVVTASAIRRLVLLHSVIAFFFNVIIVAITVSVVAGTL
jgi:uncharacterized membrane protein